MDATLFEQLLVEPTATIRDAIEHISAAGAQIALVVDRERRLLGTVSDGDIRRALLHGVDLGEPVARVTHPDPVTARFGAPEQELRTLMTVHGVQQIPLLENGRVRDVALLKDIAAHSAVDRSVVIVAGGEGQRLRPLTEALPKPMLPVGGKPLLETTLEHVSRAGFQKVFMLVNYRGEVIEGHFGDGSRFGVDITYVREPEPLGSAGALQLVREDLDGPFLVVNGDLLTSVNLDALLSYHVDEKNSVTVGVRQYVMEVPYGVVEMERGVVSGFAEKPTLSFYVSAGVYALEPGVVDLLPGELTAVGMNELIDAALAGGLSVGGFPIHEYWLDVGHLSDYERAQDDHATYFRAS